MSAAAPHPPAPSPPRDVDLVIGYLDAIEEKLAQLVANDVGPEGRSATSLIGNARVVNPAAGQEVLRLAGPGAGLYDLFVRSTKDAGGAGLIFGAVLYAGGSRVGPLMTSPSTAVLETRFRLRLRHGEDVVIFWGDTPDTTGLNFYAVLTQVDA